MTKLEALTELAAKVEAGEMPPRDLVSTAFAHRDEKCKGFRLGELIHWIMQPDDIRAMGAAKALHEAVMGDKNPWSIGEEAGRLQGDPSNWCVGIFSYEADRYIAWECMACPARAWLLAIIRALIAQEEA